MFEISAVGATGSNPDYSFIAMAPPWWIWFIAKAPWDFIIFALSERDGRYFSDKALGWEIKEIPFWVTAVAPKYKGRFL